ncbi:MAG: PIG-L family deacetylase [bacterium]|nr:PIG-L family deacetylase [bacterium]
MPKAAFAIAAHPDDIEIMMAGTLIMLGRAGYELHVMHVADGSCGSATLDAGAIAAVRLAEARAAAALIGATHHPPLAADLEIFYERPLLTRLAAVVREVAPEILLLPSLEDYMEDHANTARLAVTAAFTRGMRNFATDPPRRPGDQPVALYHALPYGLRDPLRRLAIPHFVIDIAAVLTLKRAMLACHRSQKEWLDRSQGIDSYLTNMETMAAEVGRRWGRGAAAEGWRRHLHLGFADENFDPLGAALAGRMTVCEQS